jgi:Na+/proline symporter
MYEMVQNAYKVTLVGAFVPLAAGIYWKRANIGGAIMSIVLGLSSWGAMEIWGGESMWPPQLVGLGFAIAGMLVGSLVTRVPGHTEAALAPHHLHTGGRR